jgi:hypothetical protein
MKFNRSILASLATLGLVALAGCGSSQTIQTETSPETSSETSPMTESPTAESPTAESPVAKAPATAPTSGGNHGGQGGQVIETGVYHLEFISLEEGDTVHLDFYLQKGDNHEAVSGAKVTAQVQFPDGSQKALPMEYDPEGKHYFAKLDGAGAGAYQVAVLSDIQGEKVNGRFKFDK